MKTHVLNRDVKSYRRFPKVHADEEGKLVSSAVKSMLLSYRNTYDDETNHGKNKGPNCPHTLSCKNVCATVLKAETMRSSSILQKCTFVQLNFVPTKYQTAFFQRHAPIGQTRSVLRSSTKSPLKPGENSSFAFPTAFFATSISG